MAQIAKLELQTDIKSSADKFFDIFRSKAYLIPKICPEKINNVQLFQGDWNSVGSVKTWTYAIEATESTKEKVEAIDEQNKSITFKVIEGELLNVYKSIKSTCQVTPKGSGSSVKWTMEYEKLNENVPSPDKYLESAISVTKDVDVYLLKMM